MSFTSLAKSVMGLRIKKSSGDVLWFKIAVNQTATQSFADPPIITQKPSIQASPLLHSASETLSVRGRDIIKALSNDRRFLLYAALLKSMDAEFQQANAL